MIMLLEKWLSAVVTIHAHLINSQRYSPEYERTMKMVRRVRFELTIISSLEERRNGPGYATDAKLFSFFKPTFEANWLGLRESNSHLMGQNHRHFTLCKTPRKWHPRRGSNSQSPP